MKRFLQIVGLMTLSATLSLPSAGQQSCSKIVLSPNLQVPDGLLSLADLLPPESCPAIRAAASQVPLGRAPLPGSARLLTGDGVRHLLAGISSRMGRAAAPAEFRVPDRIRLRRRDARMSCADIARQIVAMLRGQLPGAGTDSGGSEGPGSEFLSPGNFDCGVADRVPAAAVLELDRRFQDPASRSLEFSVRCRDRHDCVPFLVHEKVSGEQAAVLSTVSRSRGSSTRLPTSRVPGIVPSRPSTPLLVRPGQMARLLWERDGIRVVLPVICLDRGSRGDSVRVRVRNGSRVLRAEVESAGVLRASL